MKILNVLITIIMALSVMSAQATDSKPITELSSRSSSKRLPRASIYTPAANTVAACSLDIDGNGLADALTDGILIVRHLFGFSGNTLISGAVGGAASRTTAEQISDYLDLCSEIFDIDDNGQIEALTDGILILRQLFGFSGNALTDGAIAANANRTDAQDIVDYMVFYKNLTAAVELHAPDLTAPVLSGIPTTLFLKTRYSGSKIVSYLLLEGPNGVVVDANTGDVNWTPPITAEGTAPVIKVQATDGEAFATVDFTVAVAMPTPLLTTVQGDSVIVAESGSLLGLRITPPVSTGPNNIIIGMFDVSSVPTIPAYVTRLTDFFRTTPINAGDDEITVSFPNIIIPAPYTKNDLSLFVLVQDEEETTDFFWHRARRNLTVENGNVSVQLKRTGEVSFIGLIDRGQAQPRLITRATSTGTQNGIASTCIDTAAAGEEKKCTVTGDATFEAIVTDFSTNNWQGNPTIHHLMSWLVLAKQEFATLGLSFKNKFKVIVEPMDYLGYVSSLENREILHLTEAAEPLATMQGTSVHEYFHHAQGETKLTDHLNVLGSRGRSWIYEGTARWFEDELFDSLDTYKLKERNPLRQILQEGFNAAHGTGRNRPYARFAMWKLFSQKCSGFDLKQLFNRPNTDTDLTSMANLLARMQSWNCDFGDGFGPGNNEELAAALLHYSYSTIRVNNFALIDANESGFNFNQTIPQFDRPNFGVVIEEFEKGPQTFSLKPYGAKSFKVPGVLLPALLAGDEEFSLHFRNSIISPWVSITSEDPDFATRRSSSTGSEANTWIDLANTQKFTYQPATLFSPALFVTIVNPTAQQGTVEVTWALRKTNQEAITITSPVNSDTYDTRVIDVTGTINALPGNAASQITHILVDQVQIGGAQNLIKVSGASFSGKAIIALGQNSISLTGLDQQGVKITDPVTVQIVGQESATPLLRNALIKSNVVVVSNWKTATGTGTDIDQYVSYSLNAGQRPANLNNTIWFSDRSHSVGRQDFDDVSTFGPEVTTFPTNTAPTKEYEVNINYYSDHGGGNTDVSVDVLLNEGSNAAIIGRRYISPAGAPLTTGNFGSGFAPASDGPSWKSRVLRMKCNGVGVSQNCDIIN